MASHGGGLAPDGIQQGHLCLGKGNGDGEAGEASPLFPHQSQCCGSFADWSSPASGQRLSKT